MEGKRKEPLFCIGLSICIAISAVSTQRLTCVNHPALCAIHHCWTHIPTNLNLPNMFIVHILPGKLLVATQAVKHFLKVNSHDVAVD